MNRLWAYTGFVCLIAASAVLLQSFQSPAPPTADGATATYRQGLLRVSIPYRAPHAGEGRLRVELVSPEDEVLAQVERPVTLGTGSGRWEESLRLAAPIAVEDLVWQRVRYRFAYTGADAGALSGTESLSRILRTPVLRIIGQQKYLAGGPAAVRGVVTDSGQRPLTGSLRIELLGPGNQKRSLFAGRINERGAAEAQFRLPAGLTGTYQLRYAADTPIGSAEFTQQIQIQEQVGILLTTEKPIYQPGQTIHARALALEWAERHAAAGHALMFELEDSRGNKVFKRAVRTDDFGIASADFPLADEINLGTYHLRALMDGGNTSEIALNVDRYVLPKFKVAVEFTGKARHGYHPGENVTGIVRANYFFGKPVEGDVTVKIAMADLLPMEAGSVEGKLDASGEYRFDLRLPAYFDGPAAGATRVLVEAAVKDSAGHSESLGRPVAVSAQSILLTAIPEGGSVIPSIENQVFVVASYPDGKPAVAQLSIGEQRVSTDESGVAVVKVPGGTRALHIGATDREGNTGSADPALPVRGGSEQVLLRANRAVYRPGDAIALKVYSTKPRGAVYLDVVKDGQTILTRDVDLVNGQAELTVTATPALAGTLDLNAYVIGRDAQTITDHRLVFVQPADELKVEASTDRPEYRPGEEARVRFQVTNSWGEGVQAALGVQTLTEHGLKLECRHHLYQGKFVHSHCRTPSTVEEPFEASSCTMSPLLTSMTGCPSSRISW